MRAGKHTMKRNVLYQIASLGLAAGIVLSSVNLTTITAQAEVAERPGYLRSATYVSDAWVINFWNTESDHMEEELARIAADGFNSIILVIPWREFQPETKPITYNRYTFEKLERIMEAANEAGLWVELRVSYTWDYYAYEESMLRFRELLGGGQMRAAWLDYVEKVYRTVSGYPNFYGGFLTWEDFWNYIESPPITGQSLVSINEADRIGYQDYLKKYYTLEQVSAYYGQGYTFPNFESIYVPNRESPAYKLLYEYYDDFLKTLLYDAQRVFPDLSMEVRLDVDPVNGKGGGKVGAHHYMTFPCGHASYTSLMYSVSMGQPNQGEKITAAQAIQEMSRQLHLVKMYNGGKPIYIDQLLYMDATEQFSYNAQLYEQDRTAFLTSLPPVLRQYTNGYAVWSYQNYAHNPVYNCQFALGDRGWNTSRAEVEERGGSRQMKLQGGGSISQKISHRIDGRTQNSNYVRFTADSDQPVTVSVKLGSVTKEVQVQGAESYELNFGRLNYENVQFSASGTVYLDNIQVYNFVQDGQLHDLDGNELSCMDAMRALNGAMR